MADSTEKLRDWFNTPNGRRVSIILGLLVLALILSFLMPGNKDIAMKAEEPRKPSKDLLTGGAADDLNVETLTVRDKKRSKEIKELNDKLTASSENTDAIKQAHEREMRKLKEDLAAVRRERTAIYEEVKAKVLTDLEHQQNEFMSTVTSQFDAMPKKTGETDTFYEEPISQDVPFLPPIDEEALPLSSGQRIDLQGGDTNSPGIKLTIVGDEEKPANEAPVEPDILLPAGSMLTGVLISGMDASTSKSAQNEPYPGLVRLKLDAILPNRFTMDLRECHLVVSAYGDLSSERAYIRTEKISCVRADGAVLETAIEAWATGEDGKAGLRGQVVTRNGPLLLRGILAGVAGGIAEATQPRAIQGIQTDPNSDSLFQAPAASDVFKSGAYGGVSNGMQEMADFYIDMAKEFYPVVEIGAGREINFIISNGVKLKFKNSARG